VPVRAARGERSESPRPRGVGRLGRRAVGRRVLARHGFERPTLRHPAAIRVDAIRRSDVAFMSGAGQVVVCEVHGSDPFGCEWWPCSRPETTLLSQWLARIRRDYRYLGGTVPRSGMPGPVTYRDGSSGAERSRARRPRNSSALARFPTMAAAARLAHSRSASDHSTRSWSAVSMARAAVVSRSDDSSISRSLCRGQAPVEAPLHSSLGGYSHSAALIYH
jgi:hypothetical protein